MITSETRPPSTPARLSASEIAVLPSSWAGRLPNAPLKAPTAVRAAPTMTMSSFMENLPVRAAFRASWSAMALHHGIHDRAPQQSQ